MPPNLVAATVRQGLFTRIVGRRLLYYPELSSTMDEAAKLGEGDAEEGVVVVAEVQRAGRGRQGRSWVSQPGNLLVSVLFRPTLEALPFISIIGGIAAARAVRKVSGLDPKIKCPTTCSSADSKPLASWPRVRSPGIPYGMLCSA